MRRFSSVFLKRNVNIILSHTVADVYSALAVKSMGSVICTQEVNYVVH